MFNPYNSHQGPEIAVQDCGGHGVCVPPTGTCVCFAGYAGSNCGVCEAGFVRSPASSTDAGPATGVASGWCVPQQFTQTDKSPVDLGDIAPFPPAPPPPVPQPPPQQQPLDSSPVDGSPAAASRVVPADLAKGESLLTARTAPRPADGGCAAAEVTEEQRLWQAERKRQAAEVAAVAAGVPVAVLAGSGVLGAAWWGVQKLLLWR